MEQTYRMQSIQTLLSDLPFPFSFFFLPITLNHRCNFNSKRNNQNKPQDSEPGLERFTMLHFQTLRRWMYIGCVGKLKEHTSCIPRCDSCSLLDRCFQCPLSRHSESRECGCQFALLHRADTDS
ncbi:uncharacterized protein LOC125772193 [Anopheles funestus]|uniref:uncharacterized protein LOC125772193 n=1 Tax=Anopheles funestus TaxID=62324 RepID=UPI0020C5F8EA|nr:uncharacterized protein LOC125772193 [Anopheles funestus]